MPLPQYAAPLHVYLKDRLGPAHTAPALSCRPASSCPPPAKSVIRFATVQLCPSKLTACHGHGAVMAYAAARPSTAFLPGRSVVHCAFFSGASMRSLFRLVFFIAAILSTVPAFAQEKVFFHEDT